MIRWIEDHTSPWMMAAAGSTIFTVGVLSFLYAFYTGNWRWLALTAVCYFIIKGK